MHANLHVKKIVILEWSHLDSSLRHFRKTADT